MTASEFKQALASAGLSQRHLAELAGVDKMTVNRWARLGVPERREGDVAMALGEGARPYSLRWYRTADGLYALSHAQVLDLPHGLAFWEYCHPGHPLADHALSPHWVLKERVKTRKLRGFSQPGEKTPRLPPDASPAQFQAALHTKEI